MGFGSTGRLLRVDLSRATLTVEEFDEELYRRYPGGKALAAYLLLQAIPAGTDPLGPDNVLVLVNGLLTGAPVSTATRFTAAARSPLTGGYGESEAGGFWGPELRNAGFDGIVISGRAPEPVYLWVHDGQAEIRPAGHLWGQDPAEAQAAIREELGDRLVRVLQIGIGGENLVRYASIINELRHTNGRSGMGAVMGSKNLKGIAARGSGKYLDLAHDSAALADLGRRLAKRVREHPLSWDLHIKGTPGVTSGLNASGILPTYNFRAGAFEGADSISWDAYEREILSGRRSCYACAIRCKREVSVDDRYQVSNTYGGPEYEAVSGFGSNCGVADVQAAAKANELCNRYTLDAISTSSSVAFAMECFEHGLIGPEDTGGLDLRFGNAAAMLATVDLIARRQGIGNLLAEGVRRAAEVIGGEAHMFAMHVKGQELPMHDPRGKAGIGLGYAVSETGADHLVSYHDTMVMNAESVGFRGAIPLGIEALSPRELSPRKSGQYAVLESWSSAGKVTGFCYFGPAPRSYIDVDEVAGAVNMATGWGWGLQDLLRAGERAVNLARVFNIREGFSRRDDVLPERLFRPSEAGALAGQALSHAEFETALDELYRLKGWDPATGVPTRARLQELDIEWAADLIGAR